MRSPASLRHRLSAQQLRFSLNYFIFNRNIFILASSTNYFTAVIAVLTYASNTFLSAMLVLNTAQKKLKLFIYFTKQYSASF
jgi:hypothetical protein